MGNQQFDIGMVGLGVMGRNLVLNMRDHGFRVVGYDKDKGQVDALRKAAEGDQVHAVNDIADLAKAIHKPRAVTILVPAGPPVDSVIRDLLPHLEKGDIIVDGGNSYYGDTNVRAKAMADKGIRYFGVGISGGESGARHGPSIMPGGPREAYDRIKPILEAVAAKVDDEPCVTYLGPGSAGHYVKMVHNGIEYGIMQLIAETYDLMKRGLGYSDDKLHQVYGQWNQTELEGYLMDITAEIFLVQDEKTGKKLIDQILDEAKQKGTGKWTSQDAMDLGVPVPVTDIAVVMRNLSAFKDQRQEASKLFSDPNRQFEGDADAFVERLRNAFYAAMVMTYAQGMALLQIASGEHGYGLDLEAIARIWRGGCIIRATLLEKIRAAFRRQADLANLLLDKEFAGLVSERAADLRTVVRVGADIGIPVPALMAALGYLDAYRSPWLPANLVQAQRDYFGSHTYERIDEQGTFHTEWPEA
jgi:6-phosphogluconate dehydrogenase